MQTFKKRYKLVFTQLVVTLTLALNWTSPLADTNIFNIGGHQDANYGSPIQDAEIAFNILFNEFLKQSNERSNVIIYENVKTLHKKLKSKEVDACFASSLELLDMMDELRHDSYYALSTNGNATVRVLLIVKKDSEIFSLSDLENKSIIVSHHTDVALMHLDVELLSNSHPTHDKFFKEIVKSKNTQTSVIDLLFNKGDAVLLFDNGLDIVTELNPSLRNDIRILMKSEPYIPSFIAVRKGFPKERSDVLKKHALQLHTHSRGRHVLKMFQHETIEEIDDSAIESVKILKQRHQALLKDLIDK